ncbi:MAG: hypothetical protein LUD78_08755 [Clostridiales bacterium]|nr:hypothetical protein [Clostridiales bacterium]
MSDKNEKQERKTLYNREVGERIAKALEATGKDNSEIINICKEQGIPIDATCISKMKNGERLTAYNVVSLCELLNLDLNQILKSSGGKTDSAVSEPPMENRRHRLLSSCKDHEVEQMIGTYHCYFFPTNEHDKNLLHGKMVIGDTDDASGRCPVYFSFGTGKKNKYTGIENYKEYNGHVTISTSSIHAVYITLESDNAKLSEISYLVMHDVGTNQEGWDGQIALVLTISSDVTDRAPTAHRMLLTKRELTPKQLNQVKGQLYMNATKIYITEENFQKFVVDERLSEEFRQEFQSETSQFPYGKPSPEFLRYDEAWINGNHRLTDRDKMLAITVLREYSTSRRYLKLGNKVGRLLFSLLKLIPDEEASSPSVTNDRDIQLYEL